jgi:hypothetical protein
MAKLKTPIFRFKKKHPWPRVHSSALYTVHFQCTRCKHKWSSVYGHLPDATGRSRYYEFLEEMDRRGGKGSIDCVRGCSHPHPLIFLFRLFTLNWPICGYGEITKTEKGNILEQVVFQHEQ